MTDRTEPEALAERLIALGSYPYGNLSEAGSVMRQAAATIRRLMPRQQNEGTTHWDGCWEARGHHDCAVQYIRRLEAERDALAERVEALGAMVDRMHERADELWAALTTTREAMALFASVAQSGEQWSDRCQDALHRAIDAARALTEGRE